MTLEISNDIIENKIFLIRNQKVMIDRDLAELYGVKPIRLREQVKRNLSRFPANFMFQLNENEVEMMVSQNAIPSKKHLGGYLPYAFTEHGILMLANILRSDRAIEVSIRIIEIFVKFREMLITQQYALCFLPPYSPELNPTEKIWRYFKDRVSMIAYNSLESLQQKISELVKQLLSSTIKSICGNTYYKEIFNCSFNVYMV